MNSNTVAAFASMMHSISTFSSASLTAIEMLAWCTSMPIYFLLSIWVLLSVGPEPTPQAYFERGALFYNALTAGANRFAKWPILRESGSLKLVRTGRRLARVALAWAFQGA